jgi:predicted phosphodiesterase
MIACPTNEIVLRKQIDGVDEVHIYPFVDLHFGDGNTNVALCEKFVREIAKDPRAYFMYLGDNMNNAIKSSVSNTYRETHNPHEQKKYLIDLLLPVKDKFLCFVPGNHEGRTSKESDVELVWDIADRLGHPELYQPNMAFIELKVGFDTHLNKKNIYRIVGLHGSGGGKQVGSMANNIESFAYSIDGLDIIVCGHTHKRASTRPGKLYFPMNGNKMMQSDFLTYIASPWQSWGGYAARGMFRPSTMGVSPIILSGKTKQFTTIV